VIAEPDFERGILRIKNVSTSTGPTVVWETRIFYSDFVSFVVTNIENSKLWL
jgi:hypothetical protein